MTADATANMTSIRDLACARCGAAFTCGEGGRDGRCWCADEGFRLPIPADGDDCLCPACLRAYARHTRPSATR